MAGLLDKVESEGMVVHFHREAKLTIQVTLEEKARVQALAKSEGWSESLAGRALILLGFRKLEE